MQIRRFCFRLLISGVFIILISTNAWAGREQRARWEGVAIGVAATLVGQAILDHHHGGYHQPATVRVNVGPRHRGPGRRHYPPPPRPQRGHWEVRKVWVPPVCEKVWNPGHYNRRGHWVPGHWITVESAPGYWKKERIWIASYINHSRRAERY
ncbi:MAG: hypothetical protein HKM93_07130 [Desulfobacteraceae bacterium]|nr:hypothetical protein [Desulfobacteraceae bacterium]